MIQAAQNTTGTLLDLPFDFSNQNIQFDFSETGGINGDEWLDFNASSLNTSPL